MQVAREKLMKSNAHVKSQRAGPKQGRFFEKHLGVSFFMLLIDARVGDGSSPALKRVQAHCKGDQKEAAQYLYKRLRDLVKPPNKSVSNCCRSRVQAYNDFNALSSTEKQVYISESGMPPLCAGDIEFYSLACDLKLEGFDLPSNRTAVGSADAVMAAGGSVNASLIDQATGNSMLAGLTGGGTIDDYVSRVRVVGNDSALDTIIAAARDGGAAAATASSSQPCTPASTPVAATAPSSSVSNAVAAASSSSSSFASSLARAAAPTPRPARPLPERWDVDPAVVEQRGYDALHAALALARSVVDANMLDLRPKVRELTDMLQRLAPVVKPPQWADLAGSVIKSMSGTYDDGAEAAKCVNRCHAELEVLTDFYHV